MSRSVRPIGKSVLTLAAGLVLVACGSSPTDTPGGGGDAGEAADRLQAVYDKVDGQTGDERMSTLIGLAEEEVAESGPCGFYHSGTFTAEIEAFQELTGIEIADFEATSERVMERVRSELQAGRQGSNLILGGDDDIENLAREGGVSELETVAREYVGEDLQGDTWISPLAIMDMPAFNTEAVSPESQPRTWEEFFTEFDGRIGLELTDWGWYAGLVQRYFVEQQGMTEEEAIAMITEGFRGAQTVDGHTLTASLLASGQYDYVPNIYAHYVPSLQEEGAPVAYADMSEDFPPFYHALGVGITEGAPQPACGLLLLEFLMSEEGQDIIASRSYMPTSSTYSGTSLLEEHPYALLSTPVVPEGANPVEVQQDWIERYDQLLREAGTQQVEE